LGAPGTHGVECSLIRDGVGSSLPVNDLVVFVSAVDGG
jgi:hypothetical protein